jgi:C1A family cysteine protease
MNFDESSQEFVMEPQDFVVLNLPREIERWAMEDIGPVIEEVTKAQARIDGMDETEFPLGSNRQEMQSKKMVQQKLLGVIKNVLSEHVSVDDSSFDQLLDE